MVHRVWSIAIMQCASAHTGLAQHQGPHLLLRWVFSAGYSFSYASLPNCVDDICAFA